MLGAVYSGIHLWSEQMIPIHFAIFSDLDQKTEQAFRGISLGDEYKELSYTVDHGGELVPPVGRTPVLITGDPRRLALAKERKFRTVFCAEPDQLADCSFDVHWRSPLTNFDSDSIIANYRI